MSMGMISPSAKYYAIATLQKVNSGGDEGWSADLGSVLRNPATEMPRLRQHLRHLHLLDPNYYRRRIVPDLNYHSR